MKRKFLKTGLALTTAALVLSATVLTSCSGGEAHAHTYSDDWSFNETQHWHYANCNHDARKDIASHTFHDVVVAPTTQAGGYTSHICACGYEYKTDPVAALTPPATTPEGGFSTNWTSDEYEHWHAGYGTKEGEKANVAEHAFDGSSPDCLVCGKTVTPRLAYTLNGDGESYAVTGSGSLTDTTAAIPATYRNKPVTAVKDFAFMGKSTLTVDLSGATNLKSIGFSAFNGIANVTGNLPATLTFVGQYAFAHSGVKTVTLPEGALLEQQAFLGCTALTTLTVNCAALPESAFEGCTALNSVTLTASKVAQVGAKAFKGCTALTSLTLPESVYDVGEDAFDGTGLITTQDGVKYAANVAVGYTGGAQAVTLANGTVGVAGGAFRNKEITGVTLGNTLRFISANAFRKCDSLTEVTLPASLLRIGASAFRESGLTSVTVPATVKSVGENAFYDCASLTSVTVNAENIGKFAFSYTGVNRTLNSPEKVRPDYAKLSSVTIGSSVKTIGSNAFQYCPITALTLPEGVESIGRYAFAQTGLTSIAIPASVSFIGEYAFHKTNLTTATFAATSGWKAGSNELSASNLSNAATLLKTTYVSVDWTKA